MDWSGRQRLQREQRELKAPQERSDEEIEAVPAESACLERKSTASNEKSEYENELIVLILAIKIRKDFFSGLRYRDMFFHPFLLLRKRLIFQWLMKILLQHLAYSLLHLKQSIFSKTVYTRH